MLVNHNSIIGVNSITADGDQLYFYKEDGTDAIFNISNINVLNTSGVSTFAGLESTGDLVISGNVSVGGTLTYEDVTNVDSVGIVTARIGVKVPAGEVTVGNNIQLGNAGVITATSFVGSSQIGIQSGGVQIGAGITQLNFIGAGNTFAVNGNTIDVSIQGGAGGSVDSDAQENTVAGTLAGASLDGTAERNTLYGYEAGNDITSGDDNTCIGWQSGDKITTGYKNIAVGSEALDNCDTGNRNVAVGWEAARSLDSGYNNVALGNMAGRSWGGADECIAIGAHAASNFGLGTRVIAMGGESVWLGGTDVIGLGKQTMLRGGSQTGGIGIGYYAGQNNVGDYNIYIGYEAGKGFGNSPYTTGEYNLSLGYRSLYAVSSGNNNISIGHSTGTTITTGSNNILIGNNVQASSATATNEVVIGERLRITSSGITSVTGTLQVNGNNYPSAGPLSNRNLIINGNFALNQRGGSNTTINEYALDRWRSYGGPMGFTISQQNVLSTLSTSKYALRLQRTAGNTQTNNIGVAQGIESKNCEGLAGTQLTLSFKARAGANLSGDFAYIVFFGTGTDQNPVGMTGQTSNVTSISASTDWTSYTKTVTVPAGTTQITVGFSFTPTGTAGANDWFEVAEVQFERGSVATPYEHRSFGDELARCQRYFAKVGPVTQYAPGYSVNARGAGGYFLFSTEMLKTPVITFSGITYSNSNSLSAVTKTKHGFAAQYIAQANNTTAVTFTYTSEAEL